jgi:uncharacterized protein
MSKALEIAAWVEQLELVPHPEGGFYKETYRSTDQIQLERMEGGRSLSTGIYFLITGGNFSAFHRIKSDEMWHYYAGDPLIVHMISPNGNYEKMRIGRDLSAGQFPQGIVPAGVWFASETLGQYSLVGCTVSPGFDFQDFELATRDELNHRYPEHVEIIERLTR